MRRCSFRRPPCETLTFTAVIVIVERFLICLCSFKRLDILSIDCCSDTGEISGLGNLQVARLLFSNQNYTRS